MYLNHFLFIKKQRFYLDVNKIEREFIVFHFFIIFFFNILKFFLAQKIKRECNWQRSS